MARDVKTLRRMLGLLHARLPEMGLKAVPDPRSRQGRRWSFLPMLQAAVVGLMVGCKSLADVEDLTGEMSRAARRLLGIRRRVPDTTLRKVLCEIEPNDIRQCFYAQNRAAHRRKALAPVGLPFGVAALDGKGTSIRVADEKYAQGSHDSSGGLVRTMTATLTSARARPCLDASPIPAKTNEMGHFGTALAWLQTAYRGLNLYQMITYDAGACSKDNAAVVISHGLDYLFRINEFQPKMTREAERHLAGISDENAGAMTTDKRNGKVVVRRVFVSSAMAGFHEWQHLRTAVRVSSTTTTDGVETSREDRYFVSSAEQSKLTAAQWLLVVRSHWGVENNCHHTFDTVFDEDDHPWVETCPRGTVVIMLLRRLAYNALTLFRSVSQRSEAKRSTPWRDILRWLKHALLLAIDTDVDGLRIRKAVEVTL